MKTKATLFLRNERLTKIEPVESRATTPIPIWCKLPLKATSKISLTKGPCGGDQETSFNNPVTGFNLTASNPLIYPYINVTISLLLLQSFPRTLFFQKLQTTQREQKNNLEREFKQDKTTQVSHSIQFSIFESKIHFKPSDSHTSTAMFN